MNVKVSVIVPVYNVEAYLDRCVNSLVCQTLEEIEIILVDDGSSDKSLKKCKEWEIKDKRIKVVHKENEGLGLTRNVGLKCAHGAYVAFIDSDDFVDSDMMERLYTECIENNLDCIYSEFNVDDYPSFRVVTRPEKLYVGQKEIEELRLDIVGAEPSYISGVKYHCSSCKGLYSLKLISSYNLQFLSEREYISEDMLFNLEFLYRAERVKIVPWQYYHYCLNGTSLTHSYRPDRWEKQLKMLDILYCPEKYSKTKDLELRLARTAIFYTMSAIKNEKERSNKKMIECLNEIKIIANNKKLRKYISDYPIMCLPLKWIIYTFALKAKSTVLLYLLVR